MYIYIFIYSYLYLYFCLYSCNVYCLFIHVYIYIHILFWCKYIHIHIYIYIHIISIVSNIFPLPIAHRSIHPAWNREVDVHAHALARDLNAIAQRRDGAVRPAAAAVLPTSSGRWLLRRWWIYFIAMSCHECHSLMWMLGY